MIVKLSSRGEGGGQVSCLPMFTPLWTPMCLSQCFNSLIIMTHGLVNDYFRKTQLARTTTEFPTTWVANVKMDLSKCQLKMTAQLWFVNRQKKKVFKPRCCIFWPAFGYRHTQKQVKLCVFLFYLILKQKKGKWGKKNMFKEQKWLYSCVNYDFSKIPLHPQSPISVPL